MKKLLKKLAGNEDGAALVFVALMMVVLMGFAALVVDLGTVYLARVKLHNAADAAALAGAVELPDTSLAKSTAIDYAKLNEKGIERFNVVPTAPYNGDSTKLEVECTSKVSYIFAKFLGFNEIQISERAVAQRNIQWAGETLPFVNLDDAYKKDKNMEAWEAVKDGGAGDKESINSFLIKNYDPYSINTYFLVDYKNGIVLKDGFSNGQSGDDKNGLLSKALEAMLTPLRSKYYVFSLESGLVESLMNGGTVYVKDGNKKTLMEKTLGDLQQSDIIQPTSKDGTKSQIVLLEVKITSFDNSNQHHIKMEYLKAYDVIKGEFPPDYAWADGSHKIPKLIE